MHTQVAAMPIAISLMRAGSGAGGEFSNKIWRRSGVFWVYPRNHHDKFPKESELIMPT